ncbi:hypothetical protein QJS10_CPA10g00750 [Acorus calamus]|uniref:Uncharacterized protein n=1 Tax=Acorus calamus TaxID=4465 RepID=A0AAV9E1N5_ACOCL|nr:hypothetical protein QJS10_CPA10g00750 [Acorus calamus]
MAVRLCSLVWRYLSQGQISCTLSHNRKGVASGRWNVRFARCLREEELGEAVSLQGILRNVQVVFSVTDQVTWPFDTSTGYTASHGYDWYTHNRNEETFGDQKCLRRLRSSYGWSTSHILTRCYRAKWSPNSSTSCILYTEGKELALSSALAPLLWSYGPRLHESRRSASNISQLRTCGSRPPADLSLVAEIKRCLIPVGPWAIWTTRNAAIFHGQRFYFENMWDTFSNLVCE